MKKRNLILTLLVIILLGGGILLTWYFLKGDSTNKPTPSTPNPPAKLSEAELEKYLLEKRLDLQKYFVFNLGELKTKKEEKVSHPNFGIVNNAYIARPKLSNHLTQIGKQFVQTKQPQMVGKLTSYGKNQVYFLNEIAGGHAPVEWTGETGDKNIEENPLFYIIFEKNKHEDLYLSNYFKNNEYKGKVYTNAINLQTNFFRVCKDKSAVLEIIKTDPALAGKV